ncbi:AAA family ATPase [Mycobacteroides abscessus]|uniref:AAA family ATPase n=1 Tax=Mycobacteroides abscessus TaxID=36809 RepID=UPI000C26569E
MIVTHVNDGQKAPFSVKGSTVTVGSVSIDLQERQTSIQKVIDVCLDNQLQTMREGLGAWYVATIILPPVQEEVYDTGELDENGEVVYKTRPLPLDLGKVELRLWGLPTEYGQEQPIEEGVTE